MEKQSVFMKSAVACKNHNVRRLSRFLNSSSERESNNVGAEFVIGVILED